MEYNNNAIQSNRRENLQKLTIEPSTKYMKKYLSKLDIVEPARIRRRFDLDCPINPLKHRSQIINGIREAKRIYRENGAAYVFSSYLTTRDDNTMTMERAREILSLIDFGTPQNPRRYTIDSSYLTFYKVPTERQRVRRQQDEIIAQLFGMEPAEGNNSIGKSWRIFHHRNRVSDGRRGLFVLDRNTAPGALVGIDSRYYNIAYPYNTTVYGLYLVPTPDENEVGGMRLSSTLNCVAEQVIKYFKNSKRGHGLTDRRMQIINKWNDRIGDDGATKKDIIELEKKLKVPIIVKMLPDRIFYKSGCYKKSGPVIEILDHNFHAWGINEGDFPEKKDC
jgi:hypothetical protein